MFGFKIINEERYQSEQNAALKLLKINEELTKKNAQLEVDIESLRDQNSRLRSINAKRKDEIFALTKKNAQLKENVKDHEAFRHAIKSALPQVDFKSFYPVPSQKKCSDCTIEQPNCKKYTDLTLCMQAKPSFCDK